MCDPSVDATVGSLAHKPLAHLLAFVLGAKLSGSLELIRADGTHAATIVFKRGAIERVKTSQPVAYLGSLLYELGFIDVQELNASLLELAAKRLPHGQILLDRGSITREQLETGIREQTLRKLAHIFSFDGSTDFRFSENIDLLGGYGGTEPVLVDPCAALWRGISEFASTPHVRSIIDRIGTHSCRLTPGARLDRFQFQPDELTVVECLGARPFRMPELHALGILAPARTELLVYCLLITKQAELVEITVIEPQAAPVVPNRTGPRIKAVISAASQPRMPAASPLRAASLSHELASRATFIRARAKSIKGEDFFQRLSIMRDATADQIDREFVTLATLWDASALPPELDGVRDDCRAVLEALAEAHRTLLDPRKREQYTRALLLGRPNDPNEDLVASGAKNDLEGARACLARNDIDRAERMARRAHKAKPDQARPLALLAWIEAQRPSNHDFDATKARIAMLDRALAFDPECEEALQYRWLLHRRVDNHAGAIRDLTRIVALNPQNIDAERELRIYEMRVRRGSLKMQAVRPAATSGVMSRAEPTGLFDRLLKKR